MPKRLYDPEWLKYIRRHQNVTFRYTEFPLEELLVLNELSGQYPGLRWNLRKQRGDIFLLTILTGSQFQDRKNKGAP